MKKLNIDTDSLDFTKNSGLVTAVVQDIETKSILMVGYQNIEAVEKTKSTNTLTFWSRSRNKLWIKGEESGNFLIIDKAYVDCDKDTILYIVKAPTATCHTGSFSCFSDEKVPSLNNENSFGFLSELFDLIEGRKVNMPNNSYITSLFNQGIDRISQKVGEEAVETIIAAKNEDKKEFLEESSDLLFHFMVLCVEKGVSIKDIENNLKNRNI